MHDSFGIVQIHNRLTVASCTQEEARAVYHAHVRGMHFFNAVCPTTRGKEQFNPLPITYIAKFVDSVHHMLRNHPKKMLVACVSKDDQEALTNTALLLGGFLILGNDVGLEEVHDCFQPLSSRFIPYSEQLHGDNRSGSSITVQECWSAIYKAKTLGWIDLSDQITTRESCDEGGTFNIDEYEHYAQPANGNVHIVVPGKIVVFPTPQTLPKERLWVDTTDSEGGTTTRHFSANFFADLFSHLGVILTVCLNRASYDATSFHNSNIEVEDLNFDPDAPHLLRAIDRFLAVARAAPGLIALHSGTDGPGYTGALVASYLINVLAFDVPAAMAWLRMVDPALLGAQARELLAQDGAEAFVRLATVPAAAANPPAPARLSGGRRHRRSIAFDEAADSRLIAPAAPAAAPAVPGLFLRTLSVPERCRAFSSPDILEFRLGPG